VALSVKSAGNEVAYSDLALEQTAEDAIPYNSRLKHVPVFIHFWQVFLTWKVYGIDIHNLSVKETFWV